MELINIFNKNVTKATIEERDLQLIKMYYGIGFGYERKATIDEIMEELYLTEDEVYKKIYLIKRILNERYDILYKNLIIETAKKMLDANKNKKNRVPLENLKEEKDIIIKPEEKKNLIILEKSDCFETIYFPIEHEDTIKPRSVNIEKNGYDPEVVKYVRGLRTKYLYIVDIICNNFDGGLSLKRKSDICYIAMTKALNDYLLTYEKKYDVWNEKDVVKYIIEKIRELLEKEVLEEKQKNENLEVSSNLQKTM